MRLTPGSVSIFGLLHDQEHKVIVLISQKAWEADFVSFHPNINTETLEIPREGFHHFLSLLKNKWQLIEEIKGVC